MYNILIVTLAVIFVLGIAINIHEFGHFIVAKLFGMRVEAYSFFGLGPRIWGFKKGHTDYRISAIPLGAYVKLYGDESNAGLEGADEQGEVVPDSELYELRPRWQKFLVMIGGPFMNLMLALAIPFVGAIALGLPSMPAPIVGIVKSGGAAQKANIQVGDRIVKFGGVENPTWERIRNDALISPETPIPVVVERDGQQIPLTITPTKVTERGNSAGMLDFEPEMGVEAVAVKSLVEGEPGAQSGLQQGDKVLALNDKPVRNTQGLINDLKENKDAPFKLTVERNGKRVDLPMQARKKRRRKFPNRRWLRRGGSYQQRTGKHRTSGGFCIQSEYGNYPPDRKCLRTAFCRQAFGQRRGSCGTCRNCADHRADG